MRLIRKTAFCAAIALISALIFADVYRLPSKAAETSGVNVVHGIFESLEKQQDAWVITLTVAQQKASGPLSADCKYYDHEGKEMSRELFSASFIGESIMVEISNKSGDVIACRVERFFYSD